MKTIVVLLLLLCSACATPSQMKVVYLPRQTVELYSRLSNSQGNGDGLYFAGTAYIADDLAGEQREEVLQHEWLHHLFGA